jgi:hypothetical protein
MRILWHATHLTPASSSCFLFLFLRIGSNRPVFELRTQCVSAVSARATPRVSVGLPTSVGRRPLPRHARGSVLHGAAWCVCVAHWSSRPPCRHGARAAARPRPPVHLGPPRASLAAASRKWPVAKWPPFAEFRWAVCGYACAPLYASEHAKKHTRNRQLDPKCRREDPPPDPPPGPSPGPAGAQEKCIDCGFSMSLE